MNSKTYKKINKSLEQQFGKNMVKLIPDPQGVHEYVLRFNDDFDMSPENIQAAKDVVAVYEPSQWFDDEMREVDEWE